MYEKIRIQVFQCLVHFSSIMLLLFYERETFNFFLFSRSHQLPSNLIQNLPVIPLASPFSLFVQMCLHNMLDKREVKFLEMSMESLHQGTANEINDEVWGKACRFPRVPFPLGRVWTNDHRAFALWPTCTRLLPSFSGTWWEIYPDHQAIFEDDALCSKSARKETFCLQFLTWCAFTFWHFTLSKRIHKTTTTQVGRSRWKNLVPHTPEA